MYIKEIYGAGELHRRQRGSVLVIGMIFLVILMIGAVTIMNSSVQDEKISGNTKRSSDAFMAAEAGIAAAVDELDGANWYTGGYVCDGGVLKIDVSGTMTPVSSSPSATLVSASQPGDPFNYVVRFNDACTLDGYGFLESVGLVSDGAQTGASRTIVFDVKHGNTTWPAVFVNDNSDDATTACNFSSLGSTGTYGFFGNGGPPFATNSKNCQNHLSSYLDGSGKTDGPIAQANPAPEFTSVDGLFDFYKSIFPSSKENIDFSSDPYSSPSEGLFVYQSSYSTLNKDKDKKVIVPVEDKDVFKDASGEMNGVYIINGDFENKTGNVTGSGVLMIMGNAKFSGTPNWDGIILVMGGTVEIGGGGTSGTGFKGTMIVSDIDYNCKFNAGACTNVYYDPSDSDYGDAAYPLKNTWSAGAGGQIKWDTSGGGSAGYHYDCNEVVEAYALLEALSANTSDFDKPDCSSGSDGDYGASYRDDWYEVVNQ